MAAYLELNVEGGNTVGGVKGWPHHEFKNVEIALIDGEPRLVGFCVRPIAGTLKVDVALSRADLARIPVREIVRLVASMTAETELEVNGVFAALAKFNDLGRDPAKRPRGGSDEFSQAVETVVHRARAMGKSTIREVATTWHVGEDRANQYVAEAKRRGFLRAETGD